jgi:hypothetical protein
MIYKGEPMKTKPDIISDVRSFMKSRVILSAAELDFFSTLDGNFVSAPETLIHSGK